MRSRRKGQKKRISGSSERPLFAKIAAFIGPVFIIAGWQIMSISYWCGFVLALIGFALCLLEIVHEPELLIRPYQFQVASIGLLFTLGVVFVIEVVPAVAPLNISSYAMCKANHDDGVKVAGINWNSHYTDLRVAISNPTDNNYGDLDVTIKPDQLTRDAAIYSQSPECSLSPVPTDAPGERAYFSTRFKKSGPTNFTATRGSGFDVHDSQGNEYTLLGASAGYRLRCGNFPARYAVQLVFALVVIKPQIIEKTSPPVTGKPGEWSIAVSEWSPSGKADPAFDMFDSRPVPSLVSLRGHYQNLRMFRVHRIVNVADGD